MAAPPARRLANKPIGFENSIYDLLIKSQFTIRQTDTRDVASLCKPE
jgi:hypothetical protein